MYRLSSILYIQLLVILFVACSKESDDQSPIYYLSSVTIEGFSLSKMQIVDVSKHLDAIDFLVSSQTNNEGEVIGAFLSHPKLESIFTLSESFNDKESAEAFFRELAFTNEAQLDQFALLLKPYQVWIFRSNTGQFGKLLLLDTVNYIKDDHPVAEVKFRAGKIQSTQVKQL